MTSQYGRGFVFFYRKSERAQPTRRFHTLLLFSVGPALPTSATFFYDGVEPRRFHTGLLCRYNVLNES